MQTTNSTAEYSARYTDRFSSESTVIHNDGALLTMLVRGVRFEGRDFDSFEPADCSDPTRLASFTFQHGSLCLCTIEADIPVPVVTSTEPMAGLLTFVLELGEPLPTGQLDRERLRLRLEIDDHAYHSDGKSGWFEDEMLDVQRKLPSGTFMKTCINCAFSDYSPCGHGIFGDMICFRGNKAGYHALRLGADFDKGKYFDVMKTVSERVQETYLCSEFERRKPGTGYRG